MATVKFWIRSQGDRRPLPLLLQDTPGELVDFEEIPCGHVYPMVGLHNDPVSSVLQQRGMDNPLWVLGELVKGILNTTCMRDKYGDSAIVHAELLTGNGPKVLFSEVGLGQVAVGGELLGQPSELIHGEPMEIRQKRSVWRDLVLFGLVAFVVWSVVGGR